LGNDFDYNNALTDLAKLLRHTVILTNLHGRKRVWMETKAVAKFDAIPDRTPIKYGATFEEAVEDILKREPRVVPAHIPANKRAEWVSSLYSREKAFAAARSVDERLTNRIKKAVEESIQKGLDPGLTEQKIMQMAVDASHNWSRAYAATVYRTNVARAYTEGRFQQVQDPDVRAVAPALEYRAIMDEVTRPNHAAAHGLVADATDPVWEDLKPPNGYNCRCTAILVSKFELERRGLLDENDRVIKYEPPDMENAHRDGSPFTAQTQF